MWKEIWPSLSERCSQDNWTHTLDCEYLINGTTFPISCSCCLGCDKSLSSTEFLRCYVSNEMAHFFFRAAISPMFPLFSKTLCNPTLVLQFPRQCTFCGVKKASGKGKGTCGGCKLISYCSKPCQDGHWPSHKTVCKEIRK